MAAGGVGLQPGGLGAEAGWDQEDPGRVSLCFLATGQRALGTVWGSMVLFFVGKWILGASFVGGTFLPYQLLWAECLCPPNSCVEALSPQVMGLAMGPLGGN